MSSLPRLVRGFRSIIDPLIPPRYRRYRSLGTPPRLTFHARLFRNQEDVNTDHDTYKESSRRDLSKTALFGIETLLAVEQSSLESQSRGCAKTPILTFVGTMRVT